MKKRYLVIGSLACIQYFAKAQNNTDTASAILNKTEIEGVYNHYLQNGNNSAVTGGKGTERLIVYGPALSVKSTSGKNTLSLNLGSDIISSASTDNIDFVVSSASVLDTRMYLNAGYMRKSDKNRLKVQGGVGLSIESDYLSLSADLGLTKKSKDNQRTFSASVNVLKDDLRWGRLTAGINKPVSLIYPMELRTREWYSDYMRYSFNLKTGFGSVINKKNTMGVFPELTFQKGLLATPFHRVYFTDGSLAVEQLPDRRIKAAIALRLNSFAGGRTILKHTINTYTDNFGIKSISFENETAIKIRPNFTLLPGIRFYSQHASRYFAPFQQHQLNSKYYTSDYDLSAFRTYSAGIGFRYSPQKYIAENRMFNSLTFRYNYMYRTTRLNAHIFSLIFQATRFRKHERLK